MKQQTKTNSSICFCRYENINDHLVYFIFFTAFFFISSLVKSQPTSPVNIESIGVNDGLSQSVVYAAAQDSKGFIWIATFNGLDRYDGNNFIHFRHNDNDSFSISSSEVYAVLEDSKQRLWVGTWNNGLNYFDKVNHRFYHFLPGKRIDKIVEDGAGNLYVNDSKTITCITVKHVIDESGQSAPFVIDTVSAVTSGYSFSPEENFCFLFTDAHKNIYTTTQTGLYQLCLNTAARQVDFIKLYGYNFISRPPAFYQDAQTGKYYLLTNKEVLESNNNRFANAEKVHDGIPYYNSTFIDDDSRLWYTGNEATHLFDLKTRQDKIFASEKDNPAYQFGHLLPKLQDGNGTIWFSTTSAGIIKYSDDENQFHTLLRGKYVGRIKIVNDSEFHVYNRYRIRLGKDSAGIADLSTDEIKSLNDLPFLRDKHGSFWQVTPTSVIHCDAAFRTIQTIPIPYLHYAPLQAKVPPVGNYVAKDTFYSTVYNGLLLLDRDECLWFNCSHGFACYDTKNNQFHFTDKGENFKKLYADMAGHIWFGTDSGAVMYDKRTDVTRFYYWKPDKNNQSLADKAVISFCDDPVNPQQFIWVGTRNGLSKLDKSTGRCLNFYEKNGLPDNLIYDILPDDKGNLWMSTNKGLCCLNTTSNSFRNFDVSDGLQGNEFNGGAAIKMKDGTMVFGGTNGLTYFNPKEINSIVPPLTVITDYKVFGKPVTERSPDSLVSTDIAYANDINFSYNDNVVSFEFAGIDYRKKNSLQYRYKLIGFDKGWNYSGTAHEATYTNLDPGDYTFVAEASNTQNAWGKQSNALHVHVLPLWWQTIWFKLFSLCIIGTIVYFIYRYRMQKALEIERVRNRIARDLHDEIGSTLSAISIYSKVAHEQSKTSGINPEPLLKKINENVLHVMDAMSDIVWSVSTKNDEFENIVFHMREHAMHLLTLKGYEICFDVDESLAHFNLKMDKRQNFYLIYKEALNNIVKYAHGKHVWITIGREKSFLLLKIKDDGVGFNGIARNGNGLSNMKNRAASIGGHISVISAVGKGSEICIMLPLS